MTKTEKLTNARNHEREAKRLLLQHLEDCPLCFQLDSGTVLIAVECSMGPELDQRIADCSKAARGAWLNLQGELSRLPQEAR